MRIPPFEKTVTPGAYLRRKAGRRCGGVTRLSSRFIVAYHSTEKTTVCQYAEGRIAKHILYYCLVRTKSSGKGAGEKRNGEELASNRVDSTE
jgi:hypothetical protein